MAFFKLRKGGEESPSQPKQPESIEVMRRRARHRLIGATVLLLIGVIGFPLLFDTQPRPISVDIPIEIPDRNKVKPPAPAPRSQTASGQVTPIAEPAAVAVASAPAAASAPAKPEPAPAAQPEAKPEPKAVAKVEPKAESRPEPKSSAPAPVADDGAKAMALLEGRPVEPASAAPPAESRFVVQVGAFADANLAREARLKVEKAGLKTYTQIADTKEGKRIRVRVGPFATRGEADKAAEKIKGLDLPAAILSL